MLSLSPRSSSIFACISDICFGLFMGIDPYMQFITQRVACARARVGGAGRMICANVFWKLLYRLQWWICVDGQAALVQRRCWRRFPAGGWQRSVARYEV